MLWERRGGPVDAHDELIERGEREQAVLHEKRLRDERAACTRPHVHAENEQGDLHDENAREQLEAASGVRPPRAEVRVAEAQQQEVHHRHNIDGEREEYYRSLLIMRISKRYLKRSH